MSRIFFKVLFLSLILSLNLFAQTQKSRPNYQLLWKISGNGLTKPSYLFGTMHIQDKRVYDFSDSVLAKLQECPSFAMEITPDSMLQYLFTEMNGEKEDAVDDIKAHLTTEEYNILNKKVLEATGMEIEKLTKKDAKSVAMLLNKPVPGKKDNATFLDAYLFKIASLQKKKLIGLEYSYEYDLLDSLDGKQNKSITDLKEIIYFDKVKDYAEKMISVYWEGDLQKIQSFLGNSKQISMEIRNVRMADRMEQHMKKMPVFTAVGAAHLPGETGIIQLLIKKGYTVKPVQAAFTGVAAKFKEITDENIWINFVNEDYGYAVDFPSNPFPNKSMADSGIDFYMYPDIGSGLFYMNMSLNMPNEIKKGEEAKLFKASIDNMSKQRNSKLLKSSNGTFNGYPSCDFEIFSPSDQMYSKGKIILRNKIYYLVFIGSFRKESLYSVDANKFFKSFQLVNLKNPAWNEFISKEGGYKVYTPNSMSAIKTQIDPDSNKIALAMALDSKDGLAYFTSYIDFKKGTFIFDDSLYLASAIERMAANKSGTVEFSSDIDIAGYPGKEYLINAGETSVKGRLLLRGGRGYTYFVIGEKNKIQAEEVISFLESFKFLPFDTTLTSTYKFKEEFTLDTPSDPLIETDSSTYYYSKAFEELINFQDKNSGNSYCVMVTTYSKYYYKNSTDYYKELIDGSLKEKDSVLAQKDIKVDGRAGKEYLIKQYKTHKLAKFVVIPSENKLYQLYTEFAPDDAESSVTKSFFSSFHFVNKRKEVELFKNKAALLLKDIVAKDSSTKEEARDYLEMYEFEKADLPLLHAAINRAYDDDTLSYRPTREKLFDILTDLNQPDTYTMIEKMYTKMDSLPRLQIQALKCLLSSKSKEGYRIFEKLTDKKLPAADAAYGLFRVLYDSLELNSQMLPVIFHHIESGSFRASLYDLAVILLDSNKIASSFFIPYQEKLKEYLVTDLKEANNGIDNLEWGTERNIIAAIGLMEKFPDNPSYIKYLNELSSHKISSISIAAIKALLNNSLPVASTSIEKLASEKEYRIELYEFLDAKSKLNLYPSKYLKQNYFAESNMLAVISYDDAAPDSLVLLDNKVKTIKGVEGRYYLYKYLYKGEDGNDEWYVGVSGPHPVDKKKFVTSCDRSTYYYEGVKSKSIAEHYKALLESETEAVE